MTDITWTNDTRKLSDLVPWEHNPKRMTRKQAAGLRLSIERFGFAVPFLVSPDGDIYDGHQRQVLMNAIKEYGPDAVVDVRVSSRSLTDDERRELVVRLKQNQAGWDFEMLPNLYEREELLEWGFEPEELGMFPDEPAGDDPGPQVDGAAELREKWGVELGQLWALGEHRLICGDCTDKAVVERVMGGEKAGLLFTSPPYAQQRTYTAESADSLTDWDSLMQGAIGSAICSDDAQILVNLGMVHRDGEWMPYWDKWIEWMRAQGWRRFGWYVWDQGNGLPGDWNGRYAPSHEFVFHFNKQAVAPQKTIRTKDRKDKNPTVGFRKQGGFASVSSPDKVGQPYKIPDSVIRVYREVQRGIHTQTHPAVFSVDFASYTIESWPGDVYEPFSGSGTTIIACEQLGRRCRAAEISPGYVAVALERWATATGKTPVLLAHSSSGEAVDNAA